MIASGLEAQGLGSWGTLSSSRPPLGPGVKCSWASRGVPAGQDNAFQVVSTLPGAGHSELPSLFQRLHFGGF